MGTEPGGQGGRRAGNPEHAAGGPEEERRTPAAQAQRETSQPGAPRTGTGGGRLRPPPPGEDRRPSPLESQPPLPAREWGQRWGAASRHRAEDKPGRSGSRPRGRNQRDKDQRTETWGKKLKGRGAGKRRNGGPRSLGRSSSPQVPWYKSSLSSAVVLVACKGSCGSF